MKSAMQILGPALLGLGMVTGVAGKSPPSEVLEDGPSIRTSMSPGSMVGPAAISTEQAAAIAMNDLRETPDGVAHRCQQPRLHELDPARRSQTNLVAVVGDRDAAHELHHEERRPLEVTPRPSWKATRCGRTSSVS